MDVVYTGVVIYDGIHVVVVFGVVQDVDVFVYVDVDGVVVNFGIACCQCTYAVGAAVAGSDVVDCVVVVVVVHIVIYVISGVVSDDGVVVYVGVLTDAVAVCAVVVVVVVVAALMSSVLLIALGLSPL